MTPEQLHELLTQAETAERQGKFEEAEQQLLQILDALGISTPSTEGSSDLSLLRASATRQLGVISWRRGDHTKALEYLGRALQQSEALEDTEGLSKVLGNIGLVHASLSDSSKALEFYGKALTLAEELGNKALVAHHLGNIGLMHWNLSDYPKALEYYGQTLTMAEELGNKALVASMVGNTGIVYANLSDYPRSLEYFGKALRIAEELGDKAGVATNLGNIGLIHQKLSDYPKALEYAGRALSMDEELGNKAGVARHLANIGTVHGFLSDYPKALEYLGKALNMLYELDNKAVIASTLTNLGNVHVNFSDYPKALEYFGKALGMSEDLGSKAGVAGNLGNIGIVYDELSDYPKALEYLERALSMREEMGQQNEAAGLRQSLGVLYVQPKNSNRDEVKAEKYLLESLAISQELGTKNYGPHKTLSELYRSQERFKESLYHLERYYELKDEVLSEEAKKSAVQMEQRRQIAEREKEIAIAKAAATAELNATRELLDAVLPSSIATRMIAGEKRIADYFPSVSILFADIVGFTAIATEVPPDVVVDFLNHVFDVYDEIIKRHGCEKIKTIGDGYMAISGAPSSCEDHAERMARAAIEMQNDIILPPEIRDFLPRSAEFNIRIGIHTGAAVCGVIGKERFVWDAYSDAVNTASRMESSGEPGKIHVSKDFAWLLRSRQKMTNSVEEFQMVERGNIEIKGKGSMRTYFLEKA